jgi:hypothetical protein
MGALVVRRSRRVAGGLEERIVLENVSPEPVSATVTVELAADFADAITVKSWISRLTSFTARVPSG